MNTAGTSASALELCRGNQYDLVLSDIGLPDGSGIDLVILVKRLTLADAGFDTGAAAHHRI
jgi:YesN/AraC family two-component response regulator